MSRCKRFLLHIFYFVFSCFRFLFVCLFFWVPYFWTNWLNWQSDTQTIRNPEVTEGLFLVRRFDTPRSCGFTGGTGFPYYLFLLGECPVSYLWRLSFYLMSGQPVNEECVVFGKRRLCTLNKIRSPGFSCHNSSNLLLSLYKKKELC